MKEYSDFSDLSNDDLIKFSEDGLMEIRKLREAIKKVSIQEIEKLIQTSLGSQGIKTYFVTETYHSDGRKINHTNSWLGNGVVCRVLKLGNKQWQQGKIKIKLEIEFESDNIPVATPNNNENTSCLAGERKGNPYLNNTIEPIENIFKDLNIDEEMNNLRGKL